MPPSILLDGESLSIPDVVSVAREGARVEVAPDAAQRVDRARSNLEDSLKAGASIYGVNTGFGKLANVSIPGDQLSALQRNLIRSHVAGVGDPLPTEVVRGIMLLRANVLLKETSGARSVVAQRLVDMLNARIHPVVPEQGSVGASGDLAPLSHVAYALMGEGEVTADRSPFPVPASLNAGKGKGVRSIVSAAEALRSAGIEPIEFQAKEGLSFINGTQAQTSILALLVHDARHLWRTAHGAAAMSLEALRGTPQAFESRIHRARPHPGQLESAELMRGLLAGSEIAESHREDDARVQDAYSLRCIPQILGAVQDAIEYAVRVAEVELNAATDNPLLFDGDVLSGGNFHGQTVAQAHDFLAVGLTTLAGVAERRIDRLLNPDLSHGLPAFLARNPGLESGLMMVQIAAAALVAECRTLCTPASVQSIPTDGNQEDYVPMGMTAALKCRKVLANAQRVVAIELLAAAEGLEHLKPLAPGEGVVDVYRRVREAVPALAGDRPLTPDIESLTGMLRQEAFA
jgi:histidine ammonia-lyase